MSHAELVGNDFIMMQDNARTHNAATLRNFLGATGITTLHWSARNPDMNPTEHLWDELGFILARGLRKNRRNHRCIGGQMESYTNRNNKKVNFL